MCPPPCMHMQKGEKEDLEVKKRLGGEKEDLEVKTFFYNSDLRREISGKESRETFLGNQSSISRAADAGESEA